MFAGWHSILASPQAKDGMTVLKDRSSWMVGIGLAPLAPYRRPYLQVEFYMNTWQREAAINGVDEKGEIQIDGRYYGYVQYDRLFAEKYVQLKIVPLQVRYNINEYISVGAGLLGKIDINTEASEHNVYYLMGAARDTMVSRPLLVSEGKSGDRNFGIQPFIDVNVGKVYLGPALGLRYLYGGRQGQFLNLYAAWRF